MKTIQINEIEGFQIGSAQDIENATGCTIILCKEGATAGVDVRGGGPATRETDLLNPKNMVQKIHAVTLSGGSAFGLESSSGVMQYLSEHEIGFDMKNIYIPIVCEACLFDCGVGNSKAYPNKQMGYDACIEAEKNETVTLHASDINETATYNWYDEDGNLIYTGKSFSVSQDITKKYKLEVVALDGFKDYTEIEVKVSPYKFINMAPNPASSQILLQYDIENSTSAYFIITGLSNNLSNNYILNTSTSQYNVNLTNYPAGQYTVVLVVDGKVISSKNLIKN